MPGMPARAARRLGSCARVSSLPPGPAQARASRPTARPRACGRAPLRPRSRAADARPRPRSGRRRGVGNALRDRRDERPSALRLSTQRPASGTAGRSGRPRGRPAGCASDRSVPDGRLGPGSRGRRRCSRPASTSMPSRAALGPSSLPRCSSSARSSTGSGLIWRSRRVPLRAYGCRDSRSGSWERRWRMVTLYSGACGPAPRGSTSRR